MDIKESLHPWDKAHLVMMYDLFNLSRILLAKILLRIFAYIKVSLNPSDKAYLIMMYDAFNMLLDSVC